MADPRIETDHLLNECSNANLTAVRGEPRVWVWCAFVVATIALAGSLLLSLVLGLKACPLCFYQRTFIMSLVGVLGIGLLTGAGRVHAWGCWPCRSLLLAWASPPFMSFWKRRARWNARMVFSIWELLRSKASPCFWSSSGCCLGTC